MTRSIFSAKRATLIQKAKSGNPSTFKIFLFFSSLEPDRAGINATTEDMVLNSGKIVLAINKLDLLSRN